MAHRDIKPENVFIDSQGNYKVGDFGCFFDKKMISQAETVAGTLAYMSPQQRQAFIGQATSYHAFKADVFSLGMTLYALASLSTLNEAWPIDSSMEQYVRSKVEPLPYSQTLKSLLLTMLSVREANRPTMQSILEQVVLEDSVELGMQGREAGNYEKALEALQRGREMQGTSFNSESCLELGTVLAHFGKWTEAEEVLTQGLDLQPSLESELALQLSNAIAETHYQAGQWTETVAACERTLTVGENSGHIFELQCALYYLANAHFWLEDGQGIEVLQSWSPILTSNTPKSKCLTYLFTANRRRIEEKKEEAVRYYRNGLELAKQLLPSSYLTICSMLELASLSDSSNSELYEQVKGLCEVHYPNSFYYARCLNCLGVVYSDLDRNEPAEELFLQAKDLFQTHFPLSIEFAKNLCSLGTLYKDTNRAEAADQFFLHAKDIYQTQASQSVLLPRFLFKLGLLYYNDTNMRSAAEQHWVQARDIYQRQFPEDIDFARCLFQLGELYCETNRGEAAEQHWLQARDLLKASAPESLQYARCLYSLGLLYKTKGSKQKAVANLERAQKLFARNSRPENVAECKKVIASLRS